MFLLKHKILTTLLTIYKLFEPSDKKLKIFYFLYVFLLNYHSFLDDFLRIFLLTLYFSLNIKGLKITALFNNLSLITMVHILN